jgi:hypothetical protein
MEADPVFSNNAVWHCRPEGFSRAWLSRLKDRCAGL